MSTVMSISELKVRADAYAEDCFDTKTTSRSFTFGRANSLSFGLPASTVKTGGTLTPYALEQLTYRLDAPPARWLLDSSHCPEEEKVKIINDLLDLRPEQKTLLRSKGETIRAVLSDRYTKFDNTTLVEMLGEAVQGLGTEARVHRAEVGDELRAYVLLPQITFAPDPSSRPGNHPGNGGLHPAIYVRNSEIGSGSAGFYGGLYRASCENGAIYGWNRDADRAFSFRHAYVQEATMRVLVAEAIGVALNMTEEAAARFVASQEVHLEPPNLRGIVDGWAAKYGLSVEASTNWLAAVTSESAAYGRVDDPRAFDLINAATYTAQARPALERELMERAAGEMLSSLVPVPSPLGMEYTH